VARAGRAGGTRHSQLILVAVRFAAAGKTVAFNNALETATLGSSGRINYVTDSKNAGVDFIANFKTAELSLVGMNSRKN